MRKKAVSLVLILLFVFFISFILPPSTSAKVISGKKSILIDETEVINDDLFVTGDTIEVKGTINGDLYIMGGTILVSGVVNGDILVVGGTITINGDIGDDVRLMGGNINIQNASIGDSLSVIGGMVSIDETSSIGGGLAFGSGMLLTDGQIERGLVGGGGSVTIGGSVGKDVRVVADELTVQSNAVISGDLQYTSKEKARISDAAVVSGITKQIIPEKSVRGNKRFKEAWRHLTFGFRLWSLFSALLIGFIMLYLSPKGSKKVADNIQNKTPSVLGWGFLVLILTPPALILLTISVIGVPLAFILGFIYVIGFYLAKIFVGIFLGDWLVRGLELKNIGIYLSFLMGLVLYYLLTMVPALNVFVWITTLLLGLGGVFIYTRENLFSKR